jgi:UDP-glucose 4-epimerase
MAVLVTGGAGYIGSHMACSLVDAGEAVVILDNLSTGMRSLIPQAAQFVQGNVGDAALVERIIGENQVDAIVHMAGSIVVPESISNPLLYYANNVSETLHLIAAAVHAGVRNFIFSSSAAVYGPAQDGPVTEDALLAPINPYGRSKMIAEWMLGDTTQAHDFDHMILRYFNVAGADPRGRTGQSHPMATHLIKRACLAALGRIPCVDIFGTDFPTRDGTGVRDYIHVSDLIEAHVLALKSLRAGEGSATLNCGYGRASRCVRLSPQLRGQAAREFEHVSSLVGLAIARSWLQIRAKLLLGWGGVQNMTISTTSYAARMPGNAS